MNEPHLTIGQTPSRCFGFCKPVTDWGGECQITISESLLLGKNEVVVNRWPAEGTERFLRDIVLHRTVHQWQWEIVGDHESGYRGHGPKFADRCNRIGEQLDLASVVPRRRPGRKDTQRPPANYWPYNVRPEHYYSPDIDLDRVIRKVAKPKHEPDCTQCLANILGLLEARGADETRRLLQREIDRQQAKHAGGVRAECGKLWIDAWDDPRD